MRNALIVGWKEFKTFFQTPIGWVILFAFTGIAGWFFFAAGEFFIQKQASMRGLFQFLPWLFLFYAPAITMRLWAEERRAGTVETLLTLPLKDWEIAVGKYLAAVGLVATWLLCLTPFAGVVCYFGDPDLGPIVGGFIGALLLGSAYAAIGIAASSLTENQIISLVVGVVGSFFFLLCGFDAVVGVFPDAIGGFLYQLSLSTHFHAITRGVIDFRDALYYVTFIGCFIALNVWAVRRQRGKGLTVALTVGIALVVNYLGSSVATRLDLTEDGRYTLSAATERVLGRLEDDLRITAYLSSDVPANFTNTRRDIEDLVHEFEAHARGKLRVEVVDPDVSDDLKKAAEAAGIQPVQMNAADTDKVEVKLAYLGLVIEYGTKSDKLPAIGGTDMLEYDLIRRISKMTRKGDLKIAWQVNDPFGGMQVPGMQRPPSQDRHSPTGDLGEMDAALKSEYETTTVDLKSKVADDIKAVILCNAGAGLNDVQKFHLDQFLLRGGGLVVMAEGSEPMNFGGGMGGGGSPFMRSAAQKLPDDFFDHYGFKISKDAIIDLQCAQIPRREPGLPFQVMVHYPGFPLVVGDSIDQEHPLSSRFSDIAFLWPSSVVFSPKPGVKSYDLVKSSKHAKQLEGFIDVSFDKLMEDVKTEELQAAYDKQFTLAGLLEGEFQSFFTARALPTEIVEGKPADDHAGHDHANEDGASPFDLLPGDDQGGPRLAPSGDSDDIPGGGQLRQDAAAPDAGGVAAPPVSDGSTTAPEAGAALEQPAPKKEVDYLKSSTAPTKIVVIGTSEFVGQGLVGGQMRNDLFLQSAIDYIAADNLSSLRARRNTSSSFEEPSAGAKTMAQLLGWAAMPILLAAFGAFTHMWRRTIRPAAARRRMALLAKR